MQNERAGQVAGPEDLVDVARLVTAYYALHPDPAEPGQRVAFGTSGHRGSSLATAFNEDHIAATSQAICEYRAAQGTDGPLFLGADTHALSEPARVTALEVFAANEVTVLIDQRGRLHAHPGRLARHPHPQPRPDLGARRRRRRHPLAQPARRRRVQVQPAERRPRRLRGDLLDPGPRQRDHHRRPEGRTAHPLRPRPGRTRHRPPRLPRHLRRRPARACWTWTRSAPPACASAPTRWAGPSVAYWGRIAEQHRLDLTVVNPLTDPTWRFMTLDWDGKIRMDCSSPYAMASLIEQRDRFRDRHRQRRRRRPARHRHAGRGPDEPQPLPGRGHLLPVLAPRAVARRGRDRQDAGVVRA